MNCFEWNLSSSIIALNDERIDYNFHFPRK